MLRPVVYTIVGAIGGALIAIFFHFLIDPFQELGLYHAIKLFSEAYAAFGFIAALIENIAYLPYNKTGE